MKTFALKDIALLIVALFAVAAFGQTEDAYATGENKKSGLLDPSRFTLHHSVSFGMSTSNSSSLKSQSLYTTMLQYEFSKPVTLNLDFSLPVHSTYNSAHNLSRENIESMEYLRNIPFGAHLTWEPADNLKMRLSVVRHTGAENPAYYHTPYSPFPLMDR
jgi:hypothetical protein